MAFYHEKLTVYQKSLAFVRLTQALFEQFPKRVNVRDQLERASDSIVLNIAEGNGKFSRKDRGRFFQIAHGSTLECGGCLDILVARGICAEANILEGKALLEEVVKMLCGLLNRLGIRLLDETEIADEIEAERMREKSAESEIQRQRQRQNSAPTVKGEH